MTREEIEQIIRENIRTNGRGEITAKVMAGVLESFVNYTDTQAEDFAELCRQLAAAFNTLVQEMEGRFETKADALEAAMEAFCSDLLNNHFIPWAEGLAGSLSDKMDLTKAAAEAARDAALEAKAASLEGKAAADQAGAKADDAKTAALEAKAGSILAAEKSTAAKAAIDSAADGIAEALLIIREGNTEGPVSYDGMPVLFFDYDGSIVIGYTVEEFLALDAMPANPEHDGLTAQGWNWPLADAKAYVQKYGVLHVGQMYTPTDGKMHIFITLTQDLSISFERTPGTVDWGDGSPAEVVDNNTNASHTYAAAGNYEITVDGVTVIGNNSFYGHREINAVFIPDSVTYVSEYAFYNCPYLKTLILAKGIQGLGQSSAFGVCKSLKAVVIPDSISSISDSAFTQCESLETIALPYNVTEIGYTPFGYGLKSIIIPEGVTELKYYLFNHSRALQSVVLPDGIISIGSSAFEECSIRLDCYALTPPTLGYSVFSNVNPMRIFVPDAAVADYKAATNWSEYADIIFPISEKF